MKTLRAFLRGKEGATMIEYGLIAALVALAAVAGLTTLGGNINTMMEGVGTELTTHNPSGGEGATE